MRVARTRPGRPGYTMIEMLIVLAILGILMALVASGAATVITTQKQNTSQATVAKLAGMLDRQWRAAIDEASKEQVPSAIGTMAGGDSERARVIYTKLRLKQEFPVKFQEIWTDESGLIKQSPYRDVISQSMVHDPPWDSESAACLLLALTTRVRRGVSTDESQLSTTEMLDLGMAEKNLGRNITAGDRDLFKTVRCLVDGWGRPIMFYRWPYGYRDLDPSGTSGSLSTPPDGPKNDPGDRGGLLASQNWWNQTSTGPTDFASRCYPVAPQKSYNLVPLIVSPGKDGKIGLDVGTMNVNDAAATYDNIVSNRLNKR